MGQEFRLPPETGRQVARVLRLRTGDEVVLFDGTGPEWPSTVAFINKDVVAVNVGEARHPGTEPALQITVCQALVPADRMEFVIQKVTELGAARLLPVITERVQPKDARPTERRLERWTRIATEAAEQSGRTRVPEILPDMSLEACLSSMASEGPLVLLWEEEHGNSLRTAVRESLSKASGHISVLIGPVGGLSVAEVEAAKQAGAIIAGAGPRILRAETAPVVALSILMYEASELE